jgi:hypothetical protein
MLQSIDRYIRIHNSTAVLVLAVMYSAVLYVFPDSFKFAVVCAFVFTTLFYWIVRDFFMSLFIIFTLSAFFLFPSKNYSFVYAYPFEYTYELLPTGLIATIVITVSDIFGLFLGLYFIRERIMNRQFTKMLNRPLIIGVGVVWFIYYAFSLFSALNYSPFPSYSLSLLAQSGRMALVFIGIVYLFGQKRRYVHLLYITLLSVLLFQSVVGIKQFFYKVSPSGATQQMLSSDIEERTDFPRVRGVMEHPNTNAFGLAIMSIVSVPFVLKRKKMFGWILFLSFLTIVLTQSRTIWLSLFVCLVLYCIFYPRRIFQIISGVFPKPRFVIFALFILCLVLFIVLPRLSLTSVFFTEEGGGGLRMRMLQEGWQLLWQAPWTGFGQGTNVRVFLDRMQNSYVTIFPFPIHFAPLQIALESGIPAVICFFLPFYFILRAWFCVDIKKILNNSVGMSIISGTIVIAGYCLTQPVFWAEPFLMGIFLGLAVTTRSFSEKLL